VSVILDALRRRRKESTSASSTRGIPAGLGLTSAISEVSRQRDRRVKLVALAALVALLSVWLGIRFNSREAAIEPAAAQLAQAPAVVQPPSPQPTQEPRTVNAEPRRPNPEPRSPNPEPRSPNPEPQSPNPGTDHFGLALRYQNLGDFAQAREQYLAVLDIPRREATWPWC
jgi:hypothetical protein